MTREWRIRRDLGRIVKKMQLLYCHIRQLSAFIFSKAIIDRFKHRRNIITAGMVFRTSHAAEKKPWLVVVVGEEDVGGFPPKG